ncbi:hypothetical protein Tco_1315351, partial [Tanacetum coccineum]
PSSAAGRWVNVVVVDGRMNRFTIFVEVCRVARHLATTVLRVTVIEVEALRMLFDKLSNSIIDAGLNTKGLKRQKEAKTIKKPTRNGKKTKRQRARVKNQPDQPDSVKERNKGSQKSNYKSKGQECQVFKESRAN